MILDLTVFKEQTLDITMPDGKLIHVRKPSEAMTIELIKMREINEKTAPEAVLAALNRLVRRILNSNDDGINFDGDTVSRLSVEVKSAIIKAYSEFIEELQSNPI